VNYKMILLEGGRYNSMPKQTTELGSEQQQCDNNMATIFGPQGQL